MKKKKILALHKFHFTKHKLKFSFSLTKENFRKTKITLISVKQNIKEKFK